MLFTTLGFAGLFVLLPLIGAVSGVVARHPHRAVPAVDARAGSVSPA